MDIILTVIQRLASKSMLSETSPADWLDRHDMTTCSTG